MSLFGKKQRRSVAASIPDTDWADPETVRAEWRNDPDSPEWGNAMAMFDAGPLPTQWLVIAGYLTRRLKFVLSDELPLPDDLCAEVCRRVLVLLAEPPAEPAWVADDMRQFAPAHIRLALAIMRDRGWQPEEYGGDGRVRLNIDTRMIRSAVATTRAADGNYLEYFFGC